MRNILKHLPTSKKKRGFELNLRRVSRGTYNQHDWVNDLQILNHTTHILHFLSLLLSHIPTPPTLFTSSRLHTNHCTSYFNFTPTPHTLLLQSLHTRACLHSHSTDISLKYTLNIRTTNLYSHAHTRKRSW